MPARKALGTIVGVGLTGLLGCYVSAPSTPDGEAGSADDGTLEVVADTVSDEVPRDDAPGDDAGALPVLGRCGDKRVQLDEECDDGNRLDGDECTWQCCVGVGTAPSGPAVEARPYVAEAPPVLVEEIEQVAEIDQTLPLAWTGTIYAFAPILVRDGSFESQYLELHRFAADGTFLGSTAIAHSTRQVDGASLLWTGERLALFWSMPGEGIRLQHFDEAGAPLGDSVLVVADPDATMPSADLTADGYALAWYGNPPGYPTVSNCGYGTGSVHVRLLGRDGGTAGFPDPVTLDSDAGSWPSLSVGPDGLGIAFAAKRTYDEYHTGTCEYRFVRMPLDLSGVVESGYLDWSDRGTVVPVNGGWLTTWASVDVYLPFGTTQPSCAAPFAATGEMAGPPVCSTVGGDGWVIGAAVAAGDHGAAVLALAGEVGFLRLDEAGVPVGDWIHPDPITRSNCWLVGLTWASDGFGAIYEASIDPASHGIWFQRFVPED